MMQRRTLIKSAAAAASLGAPTLGVFAQQVVTLKFHTFMAPTSNVYLNAHKAWMSKVENDSGGRIRFEGFPAMQLGGSPSQLFDQARDGVVDIVWTLAGLTPGRFPRTEVFELPFMTMDGIGASRAAWEYLETHASDEFKDVQPLAFHTHGPGVLHSKSKAINSASDLRGLKMRGPTRQATKLLAAAGASAVGMPLPQIPDALSKGVIDGAALPWEVIPSVKVHELVQHHSEFAPGKPALYNTAFVMVMNKRKYTSLPPDIKKVIDDNSGLETSAWFGKVQQDHDPISRKMATDRGNKVHVFSESETSEFVKLTGTIASEWVQEMDKRGQDGAKLLAGAKALIAKHKPKAA
ncbi:MULTISPECIES: TRAP transporter substrate-binding protein [unclassified Hydrogenophaga]|jgi:TRAP-type C4-dicarboxylate transport system substrate-binding protein|uniref:TRAP transporter substrate-binding protein n=1 Tax=unclassified Hydrogenophaga TaxID=2610897 RepID=UPI0006FC0CAE|nr:MULTISPECIES: TRAP transporter substrate-binding protein [unclassified Hydrogenophaga]PZO21394.1 MAG: C4-dicarboxylate ABC transporter [Burkholderiales bacterium]AOF87195.1 bacterial extracellular solute-binding, 7 family protein [Hydrogenophaga sp. RAC07]KRC01334.1 C4-dicarboxylate ABC transporter [Hydrogenophaga sp. Root209]MCW5669562.1 TRAP transporter substrate-binding protein [Hydrogenophaga sp.]MDP2015155.1 TRAP transporter substrate-binding protein [Hydrogenophaga sp.]